MSLQRSKVRILHCAEQHAVTLMHPEVKSVAEHRRPVSMAFLCAILRWPDRRLPSSFLYGFKASGHLEFSGVFNDKAMDEVDEGMLKEEFFGAPAIQFVKNLTDRGPGPGDQAQILFDLVQKEIARRRFSS